MAGGREVIFEIVRIGRMMRVIAVDAETGLEASIIGPATAEEAALRGLALRKLERLLARNLHG